MDIPTITRNQGGVVSVATLLKLGSTEGEIRSAVATGRLARVRNGWLRTSDADPAVVRAVKAGGRLGCVSALKHHGLWVPEHVVLHVSVPRHAGRHATSGLIAHWEGERWRDSRGPIESIVGVIRQVVECCDRDTAVAVIDSALKRRKLSMSRLRRALATLPGEYGSLLDDVDGKSESGYESVCRVRLARLGLRIRTQVELAGIGRVDLLIGDRLIVEADGKEWHEKPEAFLVDRSRDLAALRQAYLSLRLGPEHIDREWAWVECVVAAIVDRGEHLWTARQLRYRANNGFGGRHAQ